MLSLITKEKPKHLRKYTTKRLLLGQFIRPDLIGQSLVAIPEQKLPSPSQVLRIAIKNKNEVMYLTHLDIPKMLASLPFQDKFCRGIYKLCYFKFVPIKQPEQIRFDFAKQRSFKNAKVQP